MMQEQNGFLFMALQVMPSGNFVCLPNPAFLPLFWASHEIERIDHGGEAGAAFPSSGARADAKW
jgi:hypothetical protein